MPDMSDVPTLRVDELPADATILDVREADEWDAGHAPGVQHVPMSELTARYAEVPAEREVAVICRSGQRSAGVTAWLNENGFTAANVEGGMQAWRDAGRPMVAEGGGDPRVA